MSIAIRAATPADLPRLLPLLDEEFVFAKGRDISLAERFPTLFAAAQSPNLLLAVDEAQEITAALAMRRFSWRDGAEIFNAAMIGVVYTRPDRRGQGLASRLLQEAAQRLRQEGVDFAVLWTGQPAFYARLGWQGADCGLLGSIELAPSAPALPAGVRALPLSSAQAQVEALRRSCLPALTLRWPDDYRQLPLPAEGIELLWAEEDGQPAYALFGTRGDCALVYELVGQPTNFPALWQGICAGRRQVWVNERAGSPAQRWLGAHTPIVWQEKPLAMWLPLRQGLPLARLAQCYIPFFDRI